MKKIPPKTWMLETGKHLENFQMPMSFYFSVSISMSLSLYFTSIWLFTFSVIIRCRKGPLLKSHWISANSRLKGLQTQNSALKDWTLKDWKVKIKIWSFSNWIWRPPMAIFRISSIFDLLRFERTAQIGLAKTHEPWKPTLNKQDLNSSISSLQIEGPGKRLTQFTSIFGSTKARMLFECSRSSNVLKISTCKGYEKSHSKLPSLARWMAIAVWDKSKQEKKKWNLQ